MSTYGRRSFDTEDKDVIGQLLVQQVGGEHLATRSGGGAGTLTFIEGWKAIELANSLFGFEGWSCSVELLVPDFVEEKNGRYSVGVTAVVRIVLKDGTFHEDVGFGQSEQRNKGMAIEFAKKEAVTDARKRALRFFGNALGNCIYDKEHLKSVKPGKVAVGALSFEGLRQGTSFIHKSKPPPFLAARRANLLTNNMNFNNNNNLSSNSNNTNNTNNNNNNNNNNNTNMNVTNANNPNFTNNTSSNNNNSNYQNYGSNANTSSRYSDMLNNPHVSVSAPSQPTTFSFSANYNASNNTNNNNSNNNSNNTKNSNAPNANNTMNTNNNVHTNNTSMNIRDSMMDNMMNNLNNSNSTNNPKTTTLSPGTNNVSPNNPYVTSARVPPDVPDTDKILSSFQDDSFDDDVFAQMADQALQAYQNPADPNNINNVNKFSNNSSANNQPYSGKTSSPQQQLQQPSPQTLPQTPSLNPSPYQPSSYLQQYNNSPYQSSSSSNPSPQENKEGTPPDKKRKFFVDVSA